MCETPPVGTVKIKINQINFISGKVHPAETSDDMASKFNSQMNSLIFVFPYFLFLASTGLFFLLS